MSIEDRFHYVGDPTDTLAAEAIWSFKENSGRWPSWDEALAKLSEWQKIRRQEAEDRVLAAILLGEIVARLDEEGGDFFFLELGDGMEERILRRYLDMTLKRARAEDNWETDELEEPLW